MNIVTNVFGVCVKWVKRKYSSHIIHELCFHSALGVSTFVSFLNANNNNNINKQQLMECPTAYESIASVFFPATTTIFSDCKENIFAVTLNIFVFVNVLLNFVCVCFWMITMQKLASVLFVRSLLMSSYKNDFRWNIMNKCLLWDQPWSEVSFCTCESTPYIWIRFPLCVVQSL